MGVDVHQEPAYSDTVYVDSLIGPDTINTLPEATIAAFEDHGTVAPALETGVHEAARTLERLEAVGVRISDVGRTLEDEGLATFSKSAEELLATLSATRADLAAPRSVAR